MVTKDKINERAVKIAARIMVRAGLCRYESPTKCRKVFEPNESDCTGCIKCFLLGKAKAELEREERQKSEVRITQRRPMKRII